MQPWACVIEVSGFGSLSSDGDVRDSLPAVKMAENWLVIGGKSGLQQGCVIRLTDMVGLLEFLTVLRFPVEGGREIGRQLGW